MINRALLDDWMEELERVALWLEGFPPQSMWIIFCSLAGHEVGEVAVALEGRESERGFPLSLRAELTLPQPFKLNVLSNRFQPIPTSVTFEHGEPLIQLILVKALLLSRSGMGGLISINTYKRKDGFQFVHQAGMERAMEAYRRGRPFFLDPKHIQHGLNDGQVVVMEVYLCDVDSRGDKRWTNFFVFCLHR